MIAKNSVYLDESGKPVAEGPKAKSLLVRAGSEIPEAILSKHEGAARIAGGTKEAPKGEELQTQEPPETKDREKKHHGKGH